MAPKELGVFASRQLRKRLWTLGIVASIVGGAALLVVLLSPGNKFDLYSFDGHCSGDCGSYAGNALLCLGEIEGAGYCSRPCGELYQTCPTDFECRSLARDRTTAKKPGAQRHGLYCIKDGKPLARLGGPSPVVGQPVGSPSQITFEPQMIDLVRGNNRVTEPADLSD